MKNSNFKYRLLVLLDHSKTSKVALRDAVNLAKVIDGKIDLLQVKAPSKFTQYGNQIALMRTLDEQRASEKKKMKELANTISESENIPVSYKFTFGNVVNEVQDHIDQTTPDIVVIGKRKTGFKSFLKTSVTNHLLNNHKGGILISGNESNTAAFDDVSLGFLNEEALNNEITIAGDLISKSKRPLKLFKFSGDSYQDKQETPNKVVTFEFDEHAEPSTPISKYISKNGVDLLCVKRDMEKGISKSINQFNNEIAKTIIKTEVPVLVLAN
ncbi:universal stress protein [Spongiivirga citrea]|uniref:Universal stress protein n=1 Tax=Spongiivirga citrea TaxID=1481457 RepID=A0A6M0CGB6_9FLAO|nr:universal stress protein [Spongiivirga citrea]NER16861.1 universal stress protein [Spongiivirga citrea]